MNCCLMKNRKNLKLPEKSLLTSSSSALDPHFIHYFAMFQKKATRGLYDILRHSVFDHIFVMLPRSVLARRILSNFHYTFMTLQSVSKKFGPSFSSRKNKSWGRVS